MSERLGSKSGRGTLFSLQGPGRRQFSGLMVCKGSLWTNKQAEVLRRDDAMQEDTSD